ncbi:MAG: exonuclease SbcCD subunit D [Planctomycetota bacterium]
MHTSDWHAGRLWKNVDRLTELEAVLDDLGSFIERERIDLMLVSGDLFDNVAPNAAAERLVFRFLKRVGSAGAHSVVIAGNHDSAARLDAWGTLAELVQVHVVGRPRRAEDGGVIELVTRGGERVVVAAVPFAPVRTLISALELAEDETLAMQRYADGMSRIIASLAERFRDDAVNLLTAHTHLESAVFSGSERRVHLGNEWAAMPQSLPARAHYVALGHIHRPQAVAAAPCPTRYAGSPLQLDFGESGEAKSFVVVEAEPGLPAQVDQVAYRGGQELRVVEASLADLERDAEQLRASGWLKVIVPLAAPEPELNARVRRLLPNAVSVDVRLPEVVPAAPAASTRSMTPHELYRAYYAGAYGKEPDPALLAAFDRLLDDDDAEA